MNEIPVRIESKTPEELKAFASRLAAYVSSIDCVALSGDLGAGKTVFAQGLLPALGVQQDITSPTYQIVHDYEMGQCRIYHCDFYRIQPSDEEIERLREMGSSGIVVAEWADIMQGYLPSNRLDVLIEEDGFARIVTLSPHGSWTDKLQRFMKADAFLKRKNWAQAQCTAVKGDASTRSFSRLQRNDEFAILMDWPNQSDGPPIRDGLPYCEIAHLARDGHSFVAISHALRKHAGLSAPAILDAHYDEGFYLVEDLGDDVFGDLIAKRQSQSDLYQLGMKGLLAIRKAGISQIISVRDAELYQLPLYDRQALEVELELILDWYYEWRTRQKPLFNLRRSFFEIWSPYLEWLDHEPRGLILRDYHSPNLLLCADRESLSKLGVVDFQDALWGHPAYDLVSLLQDARLDVPCALEHDLYSSYIQDMSAYDPSFNADAFSKAYALLGLQRNTKILGIFARLAKRDGKEGYLKHMPRIVNYVRRNLEHASLEPLRQFYRDNLLPSDVEAENSRSTPL